MSDQPKFEYTIGGTLPLTAKSYVTRLADSELMQHLLAGDFCYVLTSRQMGKSSLMVRTAGSLREQGVKVAILDLTRIGQNLSPEQWYNGLLAQLGSALNLEDELDEYWSDERLNQLGPLQRFMRALRRIVLPAIEGQLVIFIDEIDSVRSLPFSSDEFFAGIRECYNRRINDPEFKRLAFCLLGVAQPSDLITNVYVTPFNIGQRIELKDFSFAEAQPLIQGLCGKSGNVKRSTAILHRVLYWTGGHPYLTQQLCDTVRRLDKEEFAPRDVDVVCEDLFLSSRSRETEVNLIFVRERVLASKEHRAAILDLYERVRRGKKVHDDDSNATLNPLRLSGLVIVSKGLLKVRNRIYARVFDKHWVIKNMPDAEMRRQKAAYRRGILSVLAISLPVLAVIFGLFIVADNVRRERVHQQFTSDTATAQEALNVGDYETAETIIHAWSKGGGDGGEGSGKVGGEGKQKASGGWKEVLSEWTRKSERRANALGAWTLDLWVNGRKMEASFAMRLLRWEARANDFTRIPRQSSVDADESGSDNRRGPPTGCKGMSETTVAATTFGGIPLIAAAGEDSSVQIWRTDRYGANRKPNKFASLQLTMDGNELKYKPSLIDCSHPPPHLPGIMSLSFSPDGSKLAIATGSWRNGNSKGFVLVWDMNNRDNVIVLKDPDKPTFDKTADSASWAQLKNGELYLAASSEDATVKLWRFAAKAPLSSYTKVSPVIVRPQLIKGRDGKPPTGGRVGGRGANVVALSDWDSHLMAIGFGDGHLVLYDYLHPVSEQPEYVGMAQVSGVMSMTFYERDDPKNAGKTLRLITGSRDGDLLVEDPYELKRSYDKVKGILRASDAVKLSWQPGQGVLLGLSVGYGIKEDQHGGYEQDHSHIWLLTSGSNGTVELWTITPDFRLLATFSGNRGGIRAAAFCQQTQDPRFDSGCFVSASSDSDVRLWQTAFRREVESHSAHYGLQFNAQLVGLAFPSDTADADADTQLVTAVGSTADNHRDHSEHIALWNYKKPTDLKEFPSDYDNHQVLLSGEPFLGFDVSPDGKFVVATSRNRDLVFVDLGIDSQRESLPVHVTLNPKIRIRCLNPGGTEILEHCAAHQRDYLVMGVADRYDIADTLYATGKGLCIWHIRLSESSEKKFSVVANPVNSCETPRNRPEKTGFASIERTIGMFDISPNGNLTVTSSDAKEKTVVNVWKTKDLLSGKEPDVTSGNFDSQFVNMSFSRDQKSIAALTINNHLYLWALGDTRLVPNKEPSLIMDRTLHARGQVLAFSPSDPILAVGLQDAQILLWDTNNKDDIHPIMTIRQHRGGILGLQFSPDGNALISAGNDGEVRVLKTCKRGTTDDHSKDCPLN